jgi:hypothetical protein
MIEDYVNLPYRLIITPMKTVALALKWPNYRDVSPMQTNGNLFPL